MIETREEMEAALLNYGHYVRNHEAAMSAKDAKYFEGLLLEKITDILDAFDALLAERDANMQRELDDAMKRLKHHNVHVGNFHSAGEAISLLCAMINALHADLIAMMDQRNAAIALLRELARSFSMIGS